MHERKSLTVVIPELDGTYRVMRDGVELGCFWTALEAELCRQQVDAE